MIITNSMVEAFKDASHDRNPLHHDVEYARKTPFGQPVAYGMLGVLAALGHWCDGHPFQLRYLHVAFLKPLFLETEYEIKVEANRENFLVEITKGPTVFSHIRFVVDALLPKAQEGETGLDYTFRQEAANTLLSMVGLSGKLPKSQLASLLWCSYRVGMVNPGRESLFSEAELRFHSSNNQGGIHVDVESEEFDERFNRLSQAGKGTGMEYFRLVAFRRPEHMKLNWELAETEAKSAGTWAGKRCFVTGAMRGFGAAFGATAGFAGADLCLNYRTGADTAKSLMADMHRKGIACDVYQADLLNERMVWRMAQDVAAKGKIDLLVLNATPPNRSALLLEQGGEDWMNFITRSITMTHHALRALIPLLHHDAQVVLVSSSYLDEMPAGFSHYLASKAAQETLVQAASIELPELCFISARLPLMKTDQTNLPFDELGTIEPETAAGMLLRAVNALRSKPGYHLLSIS